MASVPFVYVHICENVGVVFLWKTIHWTLLVDHATSKPTQRNRKYEEVLILSLL